jgi:hypothetical protein
MRKRRQSHDDEILKPSEAAKLGRWSVPFSYKLAAAGRIPCIRIDATSPENPNPKKKQSLVRFKKSDVIAFIEENYK